VWISFAFRQVWNRAYNAVILGDDAVPLQGSRLLILLKPGVIVFLVFSRLVTSYTKNQQQQHNNNAPDPLKMRSSFPMRPPDPVGIQMIAVPSSGKLPYLVNGLDVSPWDLMLDAPCVDGGNETKNDNKH
jgi:hypothetical protein